MKISPLAVGERLPPTFMKKVARGSENECWIWTGAKSPAGYGQIRIKGKLLLAHRVALASTGQAVDGMVVMHSCNNPSCVNPRHLSAGTQVENLQYASDLGRMVRPVACSPKEICDNGHVMDLLNTYHGTRATRGGRIIQTNVCRTCQRIWQQEYRKRKSA